MRRVIEEFTPWSERTVKALVGVCLTHALLYQWMTVYILNEQKMFDDGKEFSAIGQTLRSHQLSSFEG